MQSIPLYTPNSEAKLAEALTRVNGSAVSHTATVASVTSAARLAEYKLQQLNLPNNMLAGAVAIYTSGGRVSSGYKWARTVTQLTMVRNTRGWSVTFMATRALQGNPPALHLSVTPEQHRLAVEALLKSYSVLPA